MEKNTLRQYSRMTEIKSEITAFSSYFKRLTVVSLLMSFILKFGTFQIHVARNQYTEL